SPAISIDQKNTSKNPRSTVGTVTEIYDYLRLLYARIGIPHCPVCGREIKQQTIDQVVDQVMELPEGTKIQLMAPIVRGRKGEYVKELEAARKSGFVRVRVDGSIYDLSEEIKLEKNKKHTIEIIVDRLVVKPEVKSRLSDSLETVMQQSGGLAVVNVIDGEDLLFSQNYACPDHGAAIDELSPRMFSFNNPFGACEKCTGLGVFMQVDPDLVIPNKDLSIREGAIHASGWYYYEGGIAQNYYDALAAEYKFSLDVPVKDLPKEVIDVLLYGSKGKKLKVKRESNSMHGYFESEFEGIINNMERRFRETNSEWMKEEIALQMRAVDCPDCHGERLKPISLGVTVCGKNISDFTKMSVKEALDFVENMQLTEREKMISYLIIKEIKARLGFLKNVGLEYLTLSRSATTLSGGEAQRIRLATQIGSSLMGVLYILDEPSIGLHQRDNEKLIDTLKHLRDLGNTVIVVEHDTDTMLAADHIVDIGPGAGIHGGNVVCSGKVEDIMACEESITGAYLSGRKKIEIPEKRREGSGKKIIVRGAYENNLKHIDVEFPLGKLTVVTGVSGSGKSSLVNEILYKTLARDLNRAKHIPGHCEGIEGEENLDKVICIDQSPIGRTPRSNPATYTGVFTDIRNLFAESAESKERGFNAGRYSFTVRGGRCEACEGDGIIEIEMHFLPNIFVPCEVCKGKRYNRETLEVHYKGKNISDILNMTVEEALLFFDNVPKIKRKIQVLSEVGLGYVTLGQAATTLSGGEAQRVKLATELSKRPTGKTVYILDEPTTGLHTADVHKLIEVLQKLVDGGNTVILIEHNLDVIKVADHIIDLGPEGGDGGGTLVVAGTPEEVAACEKSYTGKFLKPILEQKL
ncbi:MAG: excinuclease ABC subunit UvrA, partial [Oscillospiraceae bacterium]|nr:excinuclease ABC subunit UvrA [Oscillospiraceae bacterium]